VNRFSLTHLSNEVLRRELSTKAAREKEASAELLAHIADFDERKLYVPAAYESMLAYCVGELGLSRDEAKQRIHIARAGRACPGVFEALEQGRVHLTGLRLLAPHLTPDNAGDLLSAAAHKSKEDIERLLAARAPRLDVPSMVAPLVEGAPEHPGNMVSQGVTDAPVVQAQSNSRVSPLSAESYSVQFARSREADERFRYAQDLLGNRVRSSDLAEVYGRAENAAAMAERARIREERERESRLLPHEEEVVPWVCALGIRESEARIAAKRCREMAGARLEDRVKRALTFFGDRVSRKVAPVSSANA
jgi:hypothetical protein